VSTSMTARAYAAETGKLQARSIGLLVVVVGRARALGSRIAKYATAHTSGGGEKQPSPSTLLSYVDASSSWKHVWWHSTVRATACAA